jgi:hypothetical protein
MKSHGIKVDGTNSPVDMVSTPVPLQYWQRTALVPGIQREPWHLGHVPTTFTLMSFSTPRAACLNVSWIVT